MIGSRTDLKGTGFPSVRLMPSIVDWNAFGELCTKRIRELDQEYSHTRTSVLLQECDGLALEKDGVEERISSGAQFPAEFTGPSFVVSSTNGETTLEWASCNLTQIEIGFEVLNRRLGDLLATHDLAKETSIIADFVVPVQEPLHLVDEPRKLQLVRSEYQRATDMAVEALRTCVVYGESLHTEMYVSAQRCMRQQLSRVKRGIYILLPNEDGRTVMARAGRDAMTGFEHAPLPEEAWEQLHKGVQVLPCTLPIEPGEYDIIVDGECAGLMAHEGLGHGVEADMIEKNRSRAVHYLAGDLGSKLVNMRDSPNEPGRSGSYFFDHEGVLSSETNIMVHGKLESTLCASSCASVTGVPTTANGRRQSPLHKAYTRLTNTDFLPGGSEFDDMVAHLKYGFYLELPLGGMEDPKGWGMQCEAALAHEIEGGKFTGRCFGPVCITGYLPHLMQSVRMVSSCFQSDGMGYCGKGHKEFVKVTSGGPHILLRARLS